MNLRNLFQDMFPKAPERNGIPEEELIPEEKKVKLPEFSTGVPVDVVSRTGAVLLTGRPTDFEDTHISLERVPGEMSFPVIAIGTDVKLRGFGEDMAPLNYSARVAWSTSVICTLDNLQFLPYQDIRSSMRQPLRVEGELYSLNDTLFNNPKPCTVLNISTGGACITSPCQYEKGRELRLRLEVVKGGGYSSFAGQIVRAEERAEGGYEYGILFAQLRRSQINGLNNDIAQYKKETRRLMNE